jgi:hypothetical protein
LEETLASLGIQDWKRTSSQYVAILQSLDRFENGSIREVAKKNGETILAGVLRGTEETDWYALAYDRNEYEFDEARSRAREALERYRDTHRVAY